MKGTPAPELRGISRLLPTRMVEKVWGRKSLPPPFTATGGEPVGEIWFEPPPEMPDLLVKYLFTSEKLSVQVHPSSDQALAGEQGKEECWLVLDAQPGACLAIGFNGDVDASAIEAAARDGSIEEMLAWHPVEAGDVFLLPPGTVHAIGPGLCLVEVQQSSDTTFRLYDYGRPRELHLERGLAVARGEPYPSHLRGTIVSRGATLIDGAHFRLDRVEGTPDAEIAKAYAGGLLVLPLSGKVSAEGATAKAGECLYARAIDAIDFSAAEVTLLTRSA